MVGRVVVAVLVALFGEVGRHQHNALLAKLTPHKRAMDGFDGKFTFTTFVASLQPSFRHLHLGLGFLWTGTLAHGQQCKTLACTFHVQVGCG